MASKQFHSINNFRKENNVEIPASVNTKRTSPYVPKQWSIPGLRFKREAIEERRRQTN